MKAAVVHEWGAAPVYADQPEPDVTGGGVVATVEASALTNLTKGLMSGKHYASKQIQLPAIPGVDGVARLEDGTRVYTGALKPYGMMAERTLVDPQGAVVVPDHVDSVTAAAIPNPGVSAWMSLQHAAAIKPGAHVLVLGATGVTGSTAVQLAKSAFGAGRVVVAGRDTARLEWLRTVGADDVIALGEEDLRARAATLHAERPFDAVLDYLWGKTAEQVLAALGASELSAPYYETRFVQIGSITGLDITLPAGILRSAGIILSGVGLGSAPPEVLAHIRSEALPKLFDMVAAGDLHLEVQPKPLADVERLWTAKEPSGTRVVLVP
ncbi:zinc-binding alcohol dehydrogenase family protein [Mycobacterium yunnanensis]|uniref:Zinc-binding alcohol dehydrogenase family protein n=1 Tax=Mycobacterium yunnanensis TaxID=368477 RepID=A0A9X2YU88_9MYCO|nr:zinc-binding alcohol dehydrogenase family protein [Mycobacterium yunnanensis]MCV7419095.1 zinc-binding alcohol dehydrogenase family protein [Mycobacterium yunnanensis]